MTPTELTQVERQILANQHLILAKLNEDKDDYEYKSNLMKREILIKGLTGEYHEIFDVYSDEVSFDICQETSDILNMYRPLLLKYSVIDGRLDEDLYQEQCITLMRAIKLFRI